MYIYENHLGGLYSSDEPIEWESLYCDTCGDSDMELGNVSNRVELRDLLDDSYYTEEYIEQFVNETFPIVSN